VGRSLLAHSFCCAFLMELHRAAQVGDDAMAAQFLAAAPESLETLDAFGRTLLHLAATTGHENTFSLILKDAASMPALLDQRDPHGFNALHCAANNGHDKLVTQLLAVRPELLDSYDREHLSPLYYAVTRGHEKAAAVLLAAKPSVFGTDWAKLLQSGCEQGSDVIVEMLLAVRPELIHERNYETGNTLLHAVSGQFKHRRSSANDDNNDNPDSPSNNNNSRRMLVNRLLSLDPQALRRANKEGYTPFDFAMQVNNHVVIDVLQWKLPIEDVLDCLSRFYPFGERKLMPRLRAAVDQQCESLLELLNDDVSTVMYAYIGFAQQVQHKKQRVE